MAKIRPRKAVRKPAHSLAGKGAASDGRKKAAQDPSEARARRSAVTLRRTAAELQAEVALRKMAEERLRVGLAAAPITLFNQDRKLRYTWCHNPNPLLGQSSIIGKTDADLFPPEQARRRMALKRRVMRTGKGVREAMLTTVGGRDHWYDMSIEPLRDAKGAVVGLTCAAVDITERKRAEMRIEDLAKFPGENPGPVLRVSEDGTLLYANAAAADLLAAWKTTVGKRIPKAWAALVRRAVKSRERREEEFELPGAVLALLIAPVPGKNYVNLYGRDVTMSRRAETQMRRAKEEWERTFNTVPDLIAILDTHHRVLRVNRAMADRLGVTCEEAVGKHCHEVVHGLPEPPGFCPHAITCADGKQHVAEVHEDALGGDFLVSTTPLRDEKDRLIGSVHVAHNITQRKKRELELARLARTLTALSHADRALVRAGTEKEFLDEACRIVVEDCGHAMVWIGFAEHDEAKSIRPAASAGFEDGYLDTLNLTWADAPRGRGPTGAAVRTGKPCACANMLTDPNFALWREEAQKRGYASSLALPLLSGNRAIGAITIYFPQPGGVSDEELRLLEALADDVAFGVETRRTRAAHAEATEAMRKGIRRFELLAATAGELLVTWEPQSAIEDLCRQVMAHLDCQVFFNFLADDEAGRLRLNACGGIPDKTRKSLKWLDYGVAACGWVARHGERMIAEHIPTTSDPRTDLVRSMGVKAYCCHPLFGAGGNVAGTLSFGTKTRETFSVEDVSLMRAVADQVAATMARMKSEHELREARDGLELKVRERTSQLESAMQALRDSSTYARTLIEASLDPLVTISPEGTITDINLATSMVTGVPRADLIGTDFADYFTEPERARAGYREAFREGFVTNYPLTIRRRDGHCTDVVYNATVYRDASGAVQGVFASARDVTERNRTRRALEENEARSRAVMEEAAEAILLADADGNILEANESLSRITGIAHGELAGRNVAEFIPPEDIEARPRLLAEVRTGKTVAVERRIARKDGSLIDFEGTARLLQDGRVLIVGHDVTERKRNLDRLRDYQARLKSMATELALLEERQRGAFARDLHDGISQTLAAAKMRLDLMKSRGAKSPDFEEVHTLVARSLEESRTLTVDLCPPVLYDLGLEPALESLVERFAGETGIEARFEGDGSPKPLTDGLRAMLYRSTRELLRNTVKHANAKKVRVSIGRQDGRVVVRVEDDGAGFDASSPRSETRDGSGFGLFSIREQLGYLGGSLDIQSEPGAGTRATLTAPLAPDTP